MRVDYVGGVVAHPRQLHELLLRLFRRHCHYLLDIREALGYDLGGPHEILRAVAEVALLRELVRL